MTKDKKPTNSAEEDPQNYLGAGVVFLVVGLGLIIPGNTRAAGIPFLILGLTFIALALRRDEPAEKPKK